ncbi:MAG: hypothetical protein IKE57_07410 [Oscillospiraceae bacterium]|nr:hypothetical protein [Oscillospiraceae bacterium]
MNWVLWGSVFWIAPLICAMLANETKFKKNIVLGVTLPYSARDDEDVAAVLREFRRRIWIACGVLLVLVVPCVFLKDTALWTAWGVWIDLCIVLPYVPYVIARRRLMELKAENGWVRESRTAVVDTSAVSIGRWLSPWLFLPPVLLCLVPILFDRAMLAADLMFAFLCLLFWFGYRYLYRNKAEMVDENAELTQALSRLRKYNWGKTWLVLSYAMALYCLSMLLMSVNAWLGLAVIAVVTVGICVFALRIEMRTRRMQEKLTRATGTGWYVDEDEHWIGGIFYHNPDDARTVVNSRIGVNSTVNIAHVPGKIFLVFLVLLLLALPFMGMILGALGSQEIALSVSDGAFTASAGATHYTVPLEEIEEAELLPQLPSGLRRISGTGMNTLIKGHFSADGMGSVEVIADPTVPPFLLIRTDSGRNYLLGARDPAVTRQVFEEVSVSR